MFPSKNQSGETYPRNLASDETFVVPDKFLSELLNKVRDGNHDHDDEDDHDDSDDITTPTVVLDNHHHHQLSLTITITTSCP